MTCTTKGLISRTQLRHMLDRLSEERIIYVSSPAGYGKTTAVRQWADGKSHAKVYITLDEYDNHIASFCERFCAALFASQPKNTALSQLVSHPGFLSAPEDFTLRAAMALSGRRRTILAVDDLHYLHNEKVLYLLLILLKRLPASFQIVLISRGEPPAGFSDLWIKGSLARVTDEHLRFTDLEIEQLYKKHGHPISSQEAREISRFTGGWAIGLYALLLAGGELEGKNLEYLDDYVLPSIWEKWDEPTREFMLCTAAARELTPSLCNALAEIDNGDAMLRELVRRGAFITQTKSGAFRYHRLFKGFLEHKLQERGDDFTRSLYHKEGQWHLSRRDFYNALDCFVHIEYSDGIEKCFGLLMDSGHEYFLIEKFILVARTTLIDRVAEQFPYIYSILCWVAFNEGRISDMIRYADLYYANQAKIAAINPVLQFNIILVRLVDFRYSLSSLIHSTGEILAAMGLALPGENGFSIGIINQNMPLLHRGTRDFSECAMGEVERNIADIRSVFGGLFGAKADLLMECLMAGLLYEQGELDKAYGHALAAGSKINTGSAPESEFFTAVVLISILDALGDSDSAARHIKLMDEMIDRCSAFYLNPNYKSFRTRRRLARGDMDAARQWLAEKGHGQIERVSFFESYVSVTTCRAYITVGDFDSAIALLTRLLEMAEAYNRPLDIIEIHILLAIAHWKKKRSHQVEAMDYLEKAVSLAYPFGYAQLFVNEGTELSGMMFRLQRSVEQRSGTVPVSFVKMLCLKMQECPYSGLTSGQAQPAMKFTDKQKTVMTQLCEGKSYRDIAESMDIKLPTLRSHIALIYKKLDVTNEADAIAKIKAMKR